MVDLFQEYDKQPPHLKTICDKWMKHEEENGFDYVSCDSFFNEVWEAGYTFDYGLDAQPFDLKPRER